MKTSFESIIRWHLMSWSNRTDCISHRLKKLWLCCIEGNACIFFFFWKKGMLALNHRCNHISCIFLFFSCHSRSNAWLWSRSGQIVIPVIAFQQFLIWLQLSACLIGITFAVHDLLLPHQRDCKTHSDYSPSVRQCFLYKLEVLAFLDVEQEWTCLCNSYIWCHLSWWIVYHYQCELLCHNYDGELSLCLG